MLQGHHERKGGKHHNRPKSLSFNNNTNQNIVINAAEFSRNKENRPELKSVITRTDNIPKQILEKLQAAEIFRDNLIFVMGYILLLPDGRLSAEQYLSLEMIYQALKRKSIYLYNLLPVLNKIRGETKAQKFRQVLSSLIINLPSYMRCSAKYWLKEIDSGNIDLDGLFSQTQEDLDLLAGINEAVIKISKTRERNDELKSYDENSKITEHLMGRVYVKIFQHLSVDKVELPQQLFGTILLDLPNSDGDSIFEEYVRFIAEQAWSEKIPNWNQHGRNLRFENPYIFIVDLVDKICQDEEISLLMKKALLYVRDHLTHSGKRIVRPTAQEAHLITQDGLNIDLLLSLLVPHHSGDTLLHLNTHFYNYMTTDENAHHILAGINRFAYITPRDLMLAFLARLQMRLPVEEVEIQRTTSALLANLLIRTGVWDISSPLKDAVSLWMVIDVINEPGADPKISDMIDYILNELMKNLTIWDRLQTTVIPDKAHCINPKDCVLVVLEKLNKILSKESVTPKLVTTIEQLVLIVRNNNTENCKDELGCANITDSSIIVPDEDVTITAISEPENEFVSSSEVIMPDESNHIEEPSDEELEVPVTPNFDNIKVPPPKTPILPPSIHPNKCIMVVVSDSNVPTVDIVRPGVNHRLPGTVILPSAVDLQAKPNKDKLSLLCGKQFNRRIIDQLMIIYGENYLSILLGRDWTSQYPTKIAVLIGLLKSAKENSKVQENIKLTKDIKKTLAALEFIAPYIFLPLLSHWKDFDVPIVWSTFLKDNQSAIIIGRSPPDNDNDDDDEDNTVTVPLINPKSWLLPVGPGDPFVNLLPKLPKGNSYEIKLRPLSAIFNQSTLIKLFGEDFEPSRSPNRGALFIFTLQRLKTIEEIKQNEILLTLIENYLVAIQRPAVSIKIPSSYFAGDVYKPLGGGWTVDLLGLMEVLPNPTFKSEMMIWSNMKDFLSKINLLDELGIQEPSVNTTRAEFLDELIKVALKTTKVIIDNRIRTALRYYQNRIIFDGNEFFKISWIWIKKFIVKVEADIGKIIETLVPYDLMPDRKKTAYNDVISFVADNPRLLDIHNDFPIEKHKTRGLFLRAFLQHLLKKRNVPVQMKNNILQLLPHVILDGPGAAKMPKPRIEIL